MVCMWVGDGECVAEVSREGVDEGCGKVAWGEVRFEMPGKHVGDLGCKVESDAVELDWKVARKGWRCLKGSVEAISCVDNGAIQPE